MAFLQSPILASRRRAGAYSPETARKFRKELQTQSNPCDFQVVQRELANNTTSFALLESNASVTAVRKGREQSKQNMEQLVTIKDGLDRVKTVEKTGIEYGDDVVERVETALIKEKLVMVKGVVDKVRERIKHKDAAEFNIIITDDDIKFKYVSNTCKSPDSDVNEDVDGVRVEDVSENEMEVVSCKGFITDDEADDVYGASPKVGTPPDFKGYDGSKPLSRWDIASPKDGPPDFKDVSSFRLDLTPCRELGDSDNENNSDCSLGFDVIEQPPCDSVSSTRSVILSAEGMYTADTTYDEFIVISPIAAKPVMTLSKEQEESFPRIHRNKVNKADEVIATEAKNIVTHIVNDVTAPVYNVATAPVYEAVPKQQYEETPGNTFYVNINHNRSRPNSRFDRKIEIVYDPVLPPKRPWSSASTQGPLFTYDFTDNDKDEKEKQQRASVVTVDSGNISDFDYSEVSSLGDRVSPTPSNFSTFSIDTQSDMAFDFDLSPEESHYLPPIPARPTSQSINRRVRQLATRATGLLHSASADLSKFRKNMSVKPRPLGFYHRNLKLKPDFDLRSQLNNGDNLNNDATLDLDTRLRLGKDVDLPELEPLPRWDIIPGYADTTAGHKAWWLRKQAAADKERKESMIKDLTGPVVQKVDVLVRAIVSRCTCKTPFQLDRVGDGKYKLPQTSQLFFVRILRNHVMVRVGGGWDTLDHFIAKHDPCRMKFKQITGGAFSPSNSISPVNSPVRSPSGHGFGPRKGINSPMKGRRIHKSASGCSLSSGGSLSSSPVPSHKDIENARSKLPKPGAGKGSKLPTPKTPKTQPKNIGRKV